MRLGTLKRIISDNGYVMVDDQCLRCANYIHDNHGDRCKLKTCYYKHTNKRKVKVVNGQKYSQRTVNY